MLKSLSNVNFRKDGFSSGDVFVKVEGYNLTNDKIAEGSGSFKFIE